MSTEVTPGQRLGKKPERTAEDVWAGSTEVTLSMDRASVVGEVMKYLQGVSISIQSGNAEVPQGAAALAFWQVTPCSSVLVGKAEVPQRRAVWHHFEGRHKGTSEREQQEVWREAVRHLRKDSASSLAAKS